MKTKTILLALPLSLAAISLVAMAGKPDKPGKPGDDPPPPPAADPAIAYVARHWSKGTEYRDLMVMNADGSNQTVVLQGRAGERFMRLDWSPDLDDAEGYQGVIAADVHREGEPSRIVLVSVWVDDNTVQSNAYTLLHTGELPGVGTLGGPAWSPDLDLVTPNYQGRLAFHTVYQIMTVDVYLDGSEVVADLTSAETLVDVTNENRLVVMDPTWSPNGDRLAYMERMTEEVGREFFWSSFIRVVDEPDPVVGPLEGFIHDLDWSRTTLFAPDGFVAFEHNDPSSDPDMHIADMSTPVTLQHEDLAVLPGDPIGRSPSWSPSDNQLVIKGRVGNQSAIIQIDLVTREWTVLTSSKRVSFSYSDWRP